MQVISVNLGEERAMQNGKASGKTGIYKLPQERAVAITRVGLAGDVIMDTENHGGVDQAVYVYSTPDYDWWSRELGRSLAPGTFGENLTLSEVESAQVAIGDLLRISEVLLEVTSPRIPCVTLAVRMGDNQFVKRFRLAERPGFYCRVLQEGSIQAGMAVQYEPFTGEKVTIREMFRDYYQPERSEQALRRYLRVPVHYKVREEKEELLRKMAEEK